MADIKAQTIITITLPGRLTEEQWLTVRAMFKNATRTEIHHVSVSNPDRKTDKELPRLQEELSVIVDPDIKPEVKKLPWETAPTKKALPLVQGTNKRF